ncbi:MAG: hypothetical protein ACRCX2_21155 [Paraclostridium sp.]
MSKTIVSTAKQCKITLETPFRTLETDRYLLFAKKDGESSIEINGLDLDEISEFVAHLHSVIKNNTKELSDLKEQE